MRTRLIATLSGLLLLAVLLRRPFEPGTSERRPPRPAEAPPAAAVRAEPPARKADGVWRCAKDPDPLRRTAEYLEVGQVDAFVAAAQDAVAGLQRARARRQQDLSAADPSVQTSIDSDASYETEREAALARLEPFLDQRERHREFREQADTWAASVWAASQGGYDRRRR
jgi:hypothetical protein